MECSDTCDKSVIILAVTMGMKWVIPILSVGSVGMLIRYLKLPQAPKENVSAIFGPNPLIAQKQINCAEKKYSVPITIVGHRGAALDAPENTLAAFKNCVSRGCNFVEFDVGLTKDKVPVILHDNDLLRVAGIKRKIEDLTWDECSQIDLSKEHPQGGAFPGQRIPSFEETIDLMLELDMKFFIDLKDTDPTVINAVCNAFKKHPELYKRAVVSSFRFKAIYDVRRRDPNIVGSMAWGPHEVQYKTWKVDNEVQEHRFDSLILNQMASWLDFWDEKLLHWFQWWFLGLSVVLLQKDAASRRDLQTWAQRGLYVFLWTVNNPLEKKHIEQNMHCSYMTDTLKSQ